MVGIVSAALAVTPSLQYPLATRADLLLARRWAMAKFGGKVETGIRLPGLYVHANNDPVQKNSRAGRPMNIAGKQYRRGLYCHATSRIVVELPGPGSRFEAVCGIDSNEQTSGGRGSVDFAVRVGDHVAFRSPLMREGMAGRPVRVDLGGATQFVLEISDGGDGIACDQADWADASVTLADGSTLWLADLPLFGPEPPAVDSAAPFSFVYGNEQSKNLLLHWTVSRAMRTAEDGRVHYTVIYDEPTGPLRVRCEAVLYADFPTVEWTLFLSNRGNEKTPIVADVKSLDIEYGVGQGPAVLHYFTGSPCTPTDYEPHQTRLDAGSDVAIATSGGRPTNSNLPYFNIEWNGGGLIAVLGWPGQWSARFRGGDGGSVHVSGGQELTHFTLLPGEEVRTPRVVLQFWHSDRATAQNVWRRWMRMHNSPHPAGKPVGPQFAACSSHQFGEMIHANDANQKLFVDRYLEEGLKLDYWWMDAGWYVNNGNWPNTGTWEVDRKRFPGGLRSITDHTHAKGVRSIVWFEPERVNSGTWLYDTHPEWLLTAGDGDRLLDLGNDEARRWWTDHADRLITEEGIDLYRTDFNIDPLAFWRAADAPDRQGITEIRYVTGFLTYLDELLRRHPNLVMDTCASGGRRNDIETLRRAVPLLRSDYILEPVAQQLHTYGIAQWIPFFGTGVNSSDPYVFWSQACPHITGCWDVRRKDLDYPTIRTLIQQWRTVAPLMLGDFYPLTPYDIGTAGWMAWQYNRPEDGKGMIMAFRRPNSAYEVARYPLFRLEPKATYRLRDVSGKDLGTHAATELMDKGLRVEIPENPGVAVVLYERLAARR